MVIVNVFGGPGAGKTTSAWEVASELKKKGYTVEYVSEYAKELVWEHCSTLLDGSFLSQTIIHDEQKRRIDRLDGQVDIVVTDSPLLLSYIYLDVEKARSDEIQMLYQMMIDDLENYTSVNYLVERNLEQKYKSVGRIHTIEEARIIDVLLEDTLRSFGVSYRRYDHQSMQELVNEIVTTMSTALGDIRLKSPKTDK